MAEHKKPTPPPAPSGPFIPPGPVDPFLEPLVWAVPGRWTMEMERIRRGLGQPPTWLGEKIPEISQTLEDATREALTAPFEPVDARSASERLLAAYSAVRPGLGDQFKWIEGLRPDEADFTTATRADFVVMLGQVMRAGLMGALDRKLAKLDTLRAYTAQMHADWRPLAQASPGTPLKPGYAVDRYNWLLGRARDIVVKQSQHVARLDEINLADMPRTVIVLDFSLMQLVRALSFA